MTISDFATRNAGQAWSLTNPEADVLRFEVRDEDYYGPDLTGGTNRERSDVVFSDQYSNGVPVHVNFDLKLEAAAPITAPFVVLAQFQPNFADGSSAQSVFDIDLIDGVMMVYVRYTDAKGVAATKLIFSDVGALDLGRNMNIDVKTVFDSTGNGRLVLSRDGVVIADYSGPLGYANQTSASWGEGIVRPSSATDTIAADFGKLTIATGDAVVFPQKTVFLDAPSRGLDSVDYSKAADGTFVAKIVGSAFEGATVSFYVDGVAVAHVTAGAGGAYVADVPVQTFGLHKLTAVSSDASGASSLASFPLTFQIVNADHIDPAASDNYFVTSGGRVFAVHSASKSWSVTSPQEGTFRFEVHDKDFFRWDFTTGHPYERSEISSKQVIANGVPVEVSYGFMLEPGAKNTAFSLVTGQLHYVTSGTEIYSPPFNIGFEGERMVMFVRYSENGASVTKKVFVDPLDVVRGQLYNIDIKAVFDPSGENGRVVVTRDGVTLVDYSGPLGYTSQTGVYWKEGIYRNANATETIAAQFSNLSLKSGDGIVFPAKSDFTAAPLLALDPADLGGGAMTLVGQTKANATVYVYEAGVLVGTAVAGADGKFNLDIAFAAGHHELMTKAVDADGHWSGFSTAMQVEVTTAADLVARFDTISKNSSPIAVRLTDTNVIPLTTIAQLNQFLRYSDVLKAIEGPFSFVLTQNSTNPAYDRQEQHYSSTGVMTEKMRFLGSTMVFDQVVAADGTSVATTVSSTGLRDVVHYAANGAVTQFERYTATGILYNLEVRPGDGSKIVSTFNQTTGIETGITTIFTDGHKLAVTLNITGRDYVRQDYTFSSTGAPVEQKRIASNGTVVSVQTWANDGSTEIHRFDPLTGAETFAMVKSVDGSYFQKAYVVSGTTYTVQQTFYNSANKLVGTDTLDLSGKLLSSVRSGIDGSKTVFTVDADGNKLGYTQTFVDASKTIVLFATGRPDLLARADHYTPSGQLVETHLYDRLGREASANFLLPDGSHQLDSFNEAGILSKSTVWKTDGSIVFYTVNAGTKVGSTTTALDGSYTVTKFVAGSETKLQLELKYSVDGRYSEGDFFNAVTGRLERMELRKADGVAETHYYNPETGAETSYTIRNPDKSRVEAGLAITGKDYTQQIATYDATGKTVEMVRRYGDADHTLAFSLKNNVDGSSEVHNYDIYGRETVRIITESDGSRDVFTFAYASGNAKAMAAESGGVSSTQAHFGSNNVKQWVDETKSDGSHVQSILVPNVTLTSHEGVKDTFNAMKGGADTFMFNAHFGKDIVVGFEAGTGAQHDVLAFDADVISDYAQLQTMMTKVGGDTLITVSSTDSVLIKNVAPTSLVADDFRFIHHQDGLNV